MTDRTPRAIFISVLIIMIALCILTSSSSAATGPDIIGTRIVLSSPVTTGIPGDLQDFIRNQGSDPAGPFEIQYFLSADPNQSNERILIGTWSVEGLKAGAQKYGNTTIVVPTSTAPGRYYLIRWIDPSGAVSGENSINNLQQSKTPIDVVSGGKSGIEGIGTIIPTRGSAGKPVPISVISNHSLNQNTEPVQVYFFLSPGTRADSSLIRLGSLTLPPLPAGGEQVTNSTLLIPSGIAEGTYYLFTSFVPLEQMIGNGSPSTFWFNEDPIEITTGGAGSSTPEPQKSEQRTPEPDVVSLETMLPNEAFIGDSFQITDSIKNIGGAEANIVRVEYQLSKNTDGTNGRHLGWRTIMSLQPDQSNSEQKLLGVPSGISPGLYYLTKKITVTSAVPEKNTNNNWWVSNQPINIRYNPADPIPDITHIRTIWPKGQPGETVQITDTITNTGRACAEGVTVAYYLSPYSQFDPATAYYLGVWKLASLCPLEQKTNTTPVTIPGDLKNGEYFLYSVIDPCSFMTDCGEGMPELDKSNNINIGTLHIGPCPFCG